MIQPTNWEEAEFAKGPAVGAGGGVGTFTFGCCEYVWPCERGWARLVELVKALRIVVEEGLRWLCGFAEDGLPNVGNDAEDISGLGDDFVVVEDGGKFGGVFVFKPLVSEGGGIAGVVFQSLILSDLSVFWCSLARVRKYCMVSWRCW